ncbi:MAG: DUF5723 family protein [Bacteroidales bacterium]
MWGTVNSNYSGSAGIAINPSSLVNSKLYMDVNLLTGDIFAENNYLHIHKEDYGLFKILGPDGHIPAYGDDENLFDRYRNKDLKHAYMNIRMQGPSFMIVVGDHAFGLHTALRSNMSMYRMPYDVANFLYEGLEYAPQHNINYNDHDAYLSNLEWGEIGLTYSGVLYKYGMDRITGGITLKYLSGVASGYLDLDHVDYIVLNDSTINILNLDARAGYSLPLNYDNNDIPDDGPLFKGRGIGADVGVTYSRTKRQAQKSRFDHLCEQRYPDYFYRVGFSLLDIGSINFTENARAYAYDNVNTYWEDLKTINYSDLNQMMDIINNRFYNDPDAAETGEKFKMILPSAFSVQLDYQFSPDWYVNATGIMPLKLGQNYIRRPMQLSFTPRYENRLYEIALPVSLYEMRYPRIGLAARLAFLTVGTDKLGGFLGLSDFEGMDIYFSIKINFSKGICPFLRSPDECLNQEYGRYRR